MLSDGDGEADICLATDGDQVVGIEAAVGPHGEFPRGSGVAHAAHRLPQEVGGASRRVSSAPAQACHQHVAGAGGHGEEG